MSELWVNQLGFIISLLAGFLVVILATKAQEEKAKTRLLIALTISACFYGVYSFGNMIIESIFRL